VEVILDTPTYLHLLGEMSIVKSWMEAWDLSGWGPPLCTFTIINVDLVDSTGYQE